MLIAGQDSGGDGVPSFSNPIISGFAPDPSIVRVGDDFYLVNSTFEYLPGIPVYHSTDLVNWRLIGHALHDPGQAELATVASSGGIHASTIRHHDELFYVITTNVIDGETVNFFVTAEDPAGPWSAHYVLEGAPGIDPSLFFDDDGRAWYVGNRIPPDREFDGQAEIWLQELDLGTKQLTGERHYLWRGCCQGVWAEGPHIYKKDGWYYLLISEGGTSFEHAMSVAISRDVTGPYQNNLRNPVLTHRHLSYDTPVTGVGHADLVELADGRWYSVLLGWRLVDGRHGILGRETFLVPVTWETEPHAWKDEPLTWPVFSPDTGRVELRFATPFEDTVQAPREGWRDEFDGDGLGLEWNTRRTPVTGFATFTDGALRLRPTTGAIADRQQYGFIGVRQRDFEFEATTQMRFAPDAAEEAGLMVVLNDRSAFRLTMAGEGRSRRLRLVQTLHGDEHELASIGASGDNVRLRVVGDYLDYAFHYSLDGETWRVLGDVVDGTALSPAVAGGYNYTGVYVGLYASANGAESANRAEFDFFSYSPTAADRDGWFHRRQPKSQGNEYAVYFLGGQSNMEGFGFTNELPDDLTLTSADVMIFTGQMALDNETHGGVGIWDTLQPGHGTGFSTDGKRNYLSDRFGPELFFGLTRAANAKGRKIAIIKYALGGSGLAEGVGYGNWHPDFADGEGVNQYDHALTTLRNAFAHADIDGDGIADRLLPAGIVWMQGEADAYDSQAAADEYGANLERLMGLLRAALRADDLPVVIGKITDSGMADDGSVMDYIGTVQEAQQDFADNDECAALVTATDDLGYLDDAWHYDSDGFVRLGIAFADAMHELEQKCGPAH